MDYQSSRQLADYESQGGTDLDYQPPRQPVDYESQGGTDLDYQSPRQLVDYEPQGGTDLDYVSLSSKNFDTNITISRKEFKSIKKKY